MDNVKRNKKETSIVVIVTKGIYGIGFGIITLAMFSLIFLSITSTKGIFTEQEFASIELTVVLGYILSIILLTLIIPALISQKLKKNSVEILNVIKSIKSQDLNFKINYGSIKEVNEILDSMDSMRLALKESLENQWRTEQNKNTQISALAHDFKTPMTILKGNMDLLLSVKLEGNCNEYIEDAKYSVEEMETYLNNLLEISNISKSYNVNLEKIQVHENIQMIVSPLIRIAREKDITITLENNDEKLFVNVDKILFKRMINNIISNALDFAGKNGWIKIKVSCNEGNAIISIIDSGPGFSQSALKYGRDQFYMDDMSRGRDKHYGLGLYIADSISKTHNGSMIILNDGDKGGAKITISIPLI